MTDTSDTADGYSQYVYEVALGSGSTAARLLDLIPDGARVLDLGPGPGSITQPLARLKGCRVTGVEVNAAAAERTKAVCERLIVADLEADAWETELGGDRFDVVLAADVLEHLSDPLAVLRRSLALLNSDGCVVVSTPNVAFRGVIAGLLQGRFRYRDAGLLDRTHVHLFGEADLREMFAEAGLTIETWQAVPASPALSEFTREWLSLDAEFRALLCDTAATRPYQFVVRAFRDSLEGAIALARSRTDAAHARQRHAEQEAATLRRTVADLRVLLRTQYDEAEQLRAAEAQDLAGRFEALNAQLANVTAERDAVVGSTIWRLSAPLRRALARVSAVRRRYFARRSDAPRSAPSPSPLPASAPTPDEPDIGTIYANWAAHHEAIARQNAGPLRREALDLPSLPRLTLALLIEQHDETALARTLASITDQPYPHWRVVCFGTPDTLDRLDPMLGPAAARDRRIATVPRAPANRDMSSDRAKLLDFLDGEWVMLLRAGDRLTVNALGIIAEQIARNPKAVLVFGDHDRWTEEGRRADPCFNSAWNPDLFLCQNTIEPGLTVRLDVARAAGGLRNVAPGCEAHDLALRVARLHPAHLHHVPALLVSVPVPRLTHAVDPASVRGWLDEACPDATIESDPTQGTVRVRYPLPEDPPLVSIIVPTRNAVDLVRTCIESLRARTRYPAWELILVDNGSDDPTALTYFASLEDDARVRVLRDDRPFNYAALNNAAAERAGGDLLLMLNNDTEVLTEDWLDEMVSHILRPEVGAVGARLWYPDGTLQHGGAFFVSGVIGHGHHALPRGEPGYCRRAILTQEVSAVTGACLLVRADVFRAVGGLDESLAIAWNDADLCAKLRALDYRIVWTPHAELIHHESVTRGVDITPERQRRFEAEAAIMTRRWGTLLTRDPHYPPHLRQDASFALKLDA